MVVSGIPERNENRHVKEIAHMALAIRHLVHESCVPPSSQNVIQLRIGLNSGM